MSNITEINENNYNNSELSNSYHSDIAKFRINDLDFPEELRNRDQFFLNVENFKYGDWNEYYNNNLKDIRSKLDVFSNAYEQVSNVERIMNRLDKLKHIDLENYDISLTNADLKEDNSVKLQLTNAQEKYVIDSNDLNKVLNEDILSEYDYEEEIYIVDQIQNNITQDSKNSHELELSNFESIQYKDLSGETKKLNIEDLKNQSATIFSNTVELNVIDTNNNSHSILSSVEEKKQFEKDLNVINLNAYDYIDSKDFSQIEVNNNYIDESILEKSLEDNRKHPNNPYGTIEDFINEKSNEENLSEAKNVMDNLNLNYKDTVDLYNKIENEINNASYKLENEDHYKKANGELQSYKKETVYEKVLNKNGLNNNRHGLYEDIRKLYAIKNTNDYLSKEIGNYQPNVNIHKNEINDYISNNKTEETKIQKLKSVELEKNVIGLLPKVDQENNYKETLSRLEKNKTTLKEDLKEYMINSKIDNAINSVKQHFENIKVKAEDIHQTFKDLGQWNTENKFVKDIDNVVNSVKELGKKHENELLKSDSDSIMTKLNSEYIELKDYVNKAEQDNNSYNKQSSIRNEYVNNTLNSKQINVDFDPKHVTKDLTDNQKAEVYNYLKDMNNHYNNRADTPSMIKERDNNLIIKQLEQDNPKLKEYRNDYINLKKSISPIKLETSNEKLNGIIKQSNKDISKMNRLDKIGFKEQRTEETKISNQNSKANKIKNNDMFKKMDKLHEESQKQQQTHSDDREPKKKPKMTR